MIRRSEWSEEPSVSDGLTVQTLPADTNAPKTPMHNSECRPTSGVRTLSAGSQIAAVTFP
jgi:hypothetical protein